MVAAMAATRRIAPKAAGRYARKVPTSERIGGLNGLTGFGFIVISPNVDPIEFRYRSFADAMTAVH
jgi:hypothetical protein